MIHAPTDVAAPHSRRARAECRFPGIIITPALIGVGAYARLVRDGSLQELRAGVAASHTHASLPQIRAASLAPSVPRRGALTGASALWVHGWRAAEPMPVPVTIAARPGVRLSEPVGTTVAWRNVTHEASVTSASMIAGVVVARPSAAVAMALSHDALDHALPASWWALHAGRATALDVEMLLPRKGPATRRAWSAWRALTNAREQI